MNKLKKTALLGLGLVTLVMGVLALSPKSHTKDQTIVLTSKNTIALTDQVSDESAAKVFLEAMELDVNLSKGTPINLVLYTPGGSVQAGLELMQNLNSLGRPINTITIFAASMGFQLVQNLGERQILSSSILMSHNASGGAEGEFGGGKESQLENRILFWKRRVQSMDEQTVKRTKGKQTLESYRNAYDHELWLNGAESIDQGYADRLVNARCDKSLSGTRHQNIKFMGMNISVGFSKCPLITGPLSVEVNVLTNKGTTMTYSEFTNLGGQTGAVCMTNKEALCLADPTVSLETIERTKVDYKRRNTMEGMKQRIGYTW